MAAKKRKRIPKLKTSRRFQLWSAGLVAVALAVLGYFIIRSFAAGPSATVSGADYVGFSAGGNLQWDANRDVRLSAMQASGARWVRFDLDWADIQAAGPTSYNWTNYDAVVNTANRLGLKVLPTIGFTPTWARPPGAPTDDSGNKYPPANMATMATFAQAAVQHYAPLGVHYWEIWNEPNLGDRWLGGVSAQTYDSMLAAVYPAIKQADPSAIVVSGGLGPHGNVGDTSNGINPVTFLGQMYFFHGGNSNGLFDAFGMHPYFMPESPLGTHSWNAWYQMYGTNPSIRSLMSKFGDANKKVWMTEVGVPTGNPPNGISVSEATQATELSQAYSMLKNWSWAGPLFWFNDRDSGPNSVPFGITKADGSVKLAYLEMQQVVHGLTTTTKDPGHAPVVYISAPLPNATLSGTAGLAAMAIDVDSPTDLSRVEFYANGKLLGNASLGFGILYAWNTKTVPNGSYQLTAKAIDKNNHSSLSSVVSVTVRN